MTLTITSLAALANAALFLWLTWRVIAHRRRDGVVLGDGDDRALAKKIRGQGNAAEQMPLALILMGLIEVQGGGDAALVLVAVLFTAGRAVHGLYFTRANMPWRLRFWGMLATLVAQGLLIVLLAARVLMAA